MSLKKLTACFTCVSMIAVGSLKADLDRGVEPGTAYEETSGATNMAPAMALGTLLICAAVSVYLNNNRSGGGSDHSHCHSH